MQNKLLYFLTTKRETKGYSENRCVGYYTTLEGAKKNAIGNADTLCEANYYQYAIIEAFGPGWHPIAELEIWYKFVRTANKVKAVKIKKPAQYKDVCNFGIG
jgi:hypothetical protein